MSRSVQPRLRRRHALLLCVLWLVGFELGPGLHVALHDVLGHHHHEAALTQHDAHAHEAGHGHGHEHEAEHGHGHEHEAEHGHAHEPEAEHGHGHDAAHEHEHGHEHATEVEFDDVSREHDLRLAEAVARCANDLNHGAHALAHRGVAAMPTPPAWPAVASAPWTSLDRVSLAFEPIRSRVPRCVRARGPPA